MSFGVLLLAHGTPDALEDMPEYLRLVRGGREPSPELVDEMRGRYAAIGGRSPLTDITHAQAGALARELGDGAPVFVGMRNWRPLIADVLRDAARAGASELLAVPMAPQYSTLSVEKYRQAVEEARPTGMTVRFVSSWHDHPGLLDAFAEILVAALARASAPAVVFTAHSLPARVVEQGDPYAREVAATAAGVAARVGLAEYRLAWQSAGRTAEAWLTPTLESALDEMAAAGRREVLLAPIGFVCDHTEILYDLDVEAAAHGRARGLAVARTESLNTSARFIRALADLVGAHRG